MTAERLKMAGCVIKDEAGRLLLYHRKNRFWEFPGGKVDPGERPIVAAGREGLEETGRAVKVRRFLGRALMTFVDAQRKRRIDYRYYAADLPKDEGEPLIAEEDVHDAREFVSPEDLETRRRMGELAVPVVVYMDRISKQAA